MKQSTPLHAIFSVCCAKGSAYALYTSKKRSNGSKKPSRCNLPPINVKQWQGRSPKRCKSLQGDPARERARLPKRFCIIEKITDQIILAAPTGRAAKRMTEITGRKAQTIHSLLEYDFSKRGFKKNRQNPLECDLIIIDEASMIDTMLMSQLLRAIPGHARLLLVGDIHQLPSVGGAGNVLRDMIASRTVVTTSLQQIYRQAEGSQITVNAHLINAGKMPSLLNDPKGDFFFLRADEPEEILKLIVGLVHKRLPEKYGWNVLQHIQVLSP